MSGPDDSDETTPLVQRSVSAVSETLENAKYQCCSGYDQLEYRKPRYRNTTLFLLCLNQFLTWSSGIAMAFWFPRLVDSK